MSGQRHPVESLLRHHAYFGTTPSADDLDDLKLPDATLRRVRDAAAKAVEMRESGDRAGANEYAADASLEILGDLPAEQRDPNYAHVDPLERVSDPAELAARIPRFGGGA